MMKCGRAVSRVFFLLLIGLWCIPGSMQAQAAGKAGGKLERFLKELQPAEIFPGAERLERLEGDVPVARAHGGGRALGYVFLNSDFANSVGYSGKPIHVLQRGCSVDDIVNIAAIAVVDAQGNNE